MKKQREVIKKIQNILLVGHFTVSSIYKITKFLKENLKDDPQRRAFFKK